MVPDWIAWSVPFASGVAGIYTGLRVGIARLEANYLSLRERMVVTEEKIKTQVGESHCSAYRNECQIRVEKSLARIETHVKENSSFVADRTRELVADVKGLVIAVAKLETKLEGAQRRKADSDDKD